MRLQQERVRTEKYYRIGYSQYLDKYLLVCTVTWVAWYERFFEITEDEYMLHQTDIERLDRLADTCYKQGSTSNRFLFSEKKEENTEEQSAQLSSFRSHTTGSDSFERI